jgi:hypothetical protein
MKCVMWIFSTHLHVSYWKLGVLNELGSLAWGGSEQFFFKELIMDLSLQVVS